MNLLPRLVDHYSSQDSLKMVSAGDGSGDRMVSRSAAVLIALTDNPHQTDLILTRRAMHLSSHAGQISFPGGMWEPEDLDLSMTALRESWEEVALPPDQVKLVAQLTPRESVFGVQVTPFLGVIPHSLELVPTLEEAEEIIAVPLAFFLENEPISMDFRERGGVKYRMPRWGYQEHEIWGLTAMIIEELLRPLR